MGKHSPNGDGLFEILWLDSNEAARYLRTCPQQIRNWVYQKKLKAYKLFGKKKLLFKKSDLDALLKPIGGEYGNS